MEAAGSSRRPLRRRQRRGARDRAPYACSTATTHLSEHGPDHTGNEALATACGMSLVRATDKSPGESCYDRTTMRWVIATSSAFAVAAGIGACSTYQAADESGRPDAA